MEPVTIALAKGRLADKTMELLEAIGVDCAEVRNPGRKLVFGEPTGRFRFILVKPSDVPTYVDHGVADIGVAGKDTLMEENRPLYELLDLGIGRCAMCVAGPKGWRAPEGATLRVATKFPGIARRHYAQSGRAIDVIKLNGSIELAPILGLSDVIVDIVETGTTLKENDLEVIERFLPISARLIANKAGYKFKYEEISALTADMAVAAGEAD